MTSRGIVNLSGGGMLVVSVARKLGSRNSFARVLCCPAQAERGRKRHPRSAKLTMPNSGVRRREDAGAIGAIAAICGFLVIPWTVGLALGLLSLQYANLIAVRNIRRDCHIGSRASYRDGRKALEAASSPTGGLALCCARLHSDHRRKTAALRGFIFCCAD